MLKRAGLKKRVHAHLFRHQVATELLSVEALPEEAVRVYMGWKHGSRMVSWYSHATSEKANELVMKARYGIKTGEEVEEPRGCKECPRCERRVEVKFKYCLRCGLILDREEIFRMSDVKLRLARILDQLAEDPRLTELLRELVKEKEEACRLKFFLVDISS